MAKVMLVEDDNNLREIYEARLAAEGYEIVSAHDGEEALALAVKEKPDLIISDIMMPKISGFDMLDLLRSTPETKDAKIVMMTALSQAEDKERADKLGADKYLVKSQVTLEDVVRVAKELLDGAAAGPLPAAVTENTPQATPVAAPTATNIPVAEPPATPAVPAPVAAPAPTPAPEPVATPPADDTPAPTAAPTQTPTDAPDTGSTDDPVPAPTPAPAPTSSVEDQIKDFISTAEQVKNNATTTPTPPTPTPAKVAPTQIPITDAPGQETPAPEPQLATPSGQKKVIEPINDLSKPSTNLDELLAKEESKTTDSNAPVPSVNTVISPDGTLSYATPPPAETPAPPATSTDSGLHTPPADDAPSAPHEPGQKIDPDSISL